MAHPQSDYWRRQLNAHYNFLERLAHRRIYDPITADAAFNYALDQLVKDDWRRLRQFRGRDATVKSFLSTVVGNLMHDYVKLKLKPIRIPQWVTACGAMWVEVFKRLCKEKRPVDETIEVLCGRDENPVPCRVDVEKAIAGILSRFTQCGRYSGEPIPIDPNDMDQIHSVAHQFPHLIPDEICQALEQVAVMEALFQLLLNDRPSTLEGNIQKKIERLRSNLNLSAEERIFLKTIYQEGLSISDTGRRMRLNANQSHGKHRRLIKKIRKALNSSGLLDDLKHMIRTN